MYSPVTVVLATKNRPVSLEHTLTRLVYASNEYDGVADILVAANGASPETICVLERFKQRQLVGYLSLDEANKPNAINKALKLVLSGPTEIVVFIDDDIAVGPQYLQKLIEPLEKGYCDATVGRIMLPECRLRPWFTEFHTAALADTNHLVDEARFDLVGANMAIHRKVFAQVPSFDCALGPGGLGFSEETLFSWQMRRCGFRIGFARDVVVYHWLDEDRLYSSAFVKRFVQQGQSEAYISRHYVHAVRALNEVAEIFRGRRPRLDEIVSQPETYRYPITEATLPGMQSQLDELISCAKSAVNDIYNEYAKPDPDQPIDHHALFLVKLYGYLTQLKVELAQQAWYTRYGVEKIRQP